MAAHAIQPALIVPKAIKHSIHSLNSVQCKARNSEGTQHFL